MRNATHIGSNKNNRRDKSHRMDPPPSPRTELKYKCKSKLVCAKSRESAKTPYKPMRKASHRGKHRKKTTRNGEIRNFLYSVFLRLAHLFARKHRKNRCEKKTQNQFRVSKVPKCQPRNRTTPRGGRRTCCQQQEQQQQHQQQHHQQLRKYAGDPNKLFCSNVRGSFNFEASNPESSHSTFQRNNKVEA